MKDPDGDAPAGEAEKAPYEEPGIAWEETLEQRPSLMAGCGKQVAEEPECVSSPGAS